MKEFNQDTTKQEEQLAKIEAKLDKNSSILKNIDNAPNRVANKIKMGFGLTPPRIMSILKP
jgi:hypothetical protein